MSGHPVGIVTAWLALALACVVLQLVATDPMMLAWTREAVLRGEAWRLVSGSWIHLSWTHLGLNLAGLAVLCGLFGRLGSGLRFATMLFAIATATTCLLQLAFPSAAWMVGLSGPLHGLFAWGSIRVLATPDPAPHEAWWRGPRIGWALLAGLALKLVLEAVLPPDSAQAAWLGGPVLHAAHQAGSIAGLVAGALDGALARRRRR